MEVRLGGIWEWEEGWVERGRNEEGKVVNTSLIKMLVRH